MDSLNNTENVFLSKKCLVPCLNFVFGPGIEVDTVSGEISLKRAVTLD